MTEPTVDNDSSEVQQETILTLSVPPGQSADIRLDIYLTGFIANATRSKVQRGIKASRVEVNGKPIKRPSYIVKPGDLIRCRINRPPPMELLPEPIPLDIVFEDHHVIVLNKPAGMVVHPGHGHRSGTLVHGLLYHVGGGAGAYEYDGDTSEEDDDDGDNEEDIGLSTVQAGPRYEGDPAIRPGIVHRLDKDTSGLMIVAKTDVAHVHLARQFAFRTIQRRYRALVWGRPDPAEGRVEATLGRDPRDRKRMAVVAPNKGKHAVTHYRVLEEVPYVSLLEFKLETGRTHQIRVHAQHIGHPVLGDPTYGGQTIRYGPITGHRKTLFAGIFAVLPRQALHAYTLGFKHPDSGEDMHFTSPLPQDMQVVLDQLRKEVS
jgi:23S rRNA pseudouridine1911/1915/1917 synthase